MTIMTIDCPGTPAKHILPVFSMNLHLRQPVTHDTQGPSGPHSVPDGCNPWTSCKKRDSYVPWISMNYDGRIWKKITPLQAQWRNQHYWQMDCDASLAPSGTSQQVFWEMDLGPMSRQSGGGVPDASPLKTLKTLREVLSSEAKCKSQSCQRFPFTKKGCLTWIIWAWVKFFLVPNKKWTICGWNNQLASGASNLRLDPHVNSQAPWKKNHQQTRKICMAYFNQ